METPEFVPFLGFVELLGKTCWCWEKRREKGPFMPAGAAVVFFCVCVSLILKLAVSVSTCSDSICFYMFGVRFVFGNLSFKYVSLK